jgi:cytochrome c553
MKNTNVTSLVLLRSKGSFTFLKAAIIGVLVLLATACSQPKAQGNIAEGENKSAICGQCHGQDGISIIPIYPNLAGQKSGYMELQLKAFRDGIRINAAMTPHARRLSDQDIKDLSAYYASLDPRGAKK